MKFIPGSSFINNTPKNGKYFKRGVVYTLKHINARGKYLKYIFETNEGEKEITFESAKQADEFLSNF